MTIKNIKSFIVNYALALCVGWIFSIILTDIPFFISILKESPISKFLTFSIVYPLHFFLCLFNFPNEIIGENIVRIDGTNGVLIAYSCLAVRHIMFFVGFMIIIKGPIKDKIWYIPMGIVIIHLVNIFRSFLTVLSQDLTPDFFNQVHIFGGRIILYSAILVLWLYWITHFNEK